MIRDLDSRDGPSLTAAAGLLGQSVPAGAAVPYTAARYDRYLAAMLAPPAHRRTALVRIVESDGVVAGVADWRLLSGAWFLNGLAVRADVRGRGLGRRLLTDGLERAAALGAATVALDVACDNAGARGLYRRSGFVEAGVTCWHDCSADEGAPAAAVRFTDWPVFRAGLAAYGFGDVSVDVPGGPAARVRVVGDVLRVLAADVSRLPLRRLREELGLARGVAVRTDGAVHDRASCAALTFARMHRPVGP